MRHGYGERLPRGRPPRGGGAERPARPRARDRAEQRGHGAYGAAPARPRCSRRRDPPSRGARERTTEAGSRARDGARDAPPASPTATSASASSTAAPATTRRPQEHLTTASADVPRDGHGVLAGEGGRGVGWSRAMTRVLAMVMLIVDGPRRAARRRGAAAWESPPDRISGIRRPWHAPRGGIPARAPRSRLDRGPEHRR